VQILTIGGNSNAKDILMAILEGSKGDFAVQDRYPDGNIRKFKMRFCCRVDQ